MITIAGYERRPSVARGDSGAVCAPGASAGLALPSKALIPMSVLGPRLEKPRIQ
jgi:hypothetical protein